MRGWWAASYVVLWLVVLTLLVVVVALARQIGVLHLRLGPRGALEVDDEGPPLGEAPVPSDAEDLSGRPVSVAGPGRARLLLFVSPGCSVCHEVLPSLPAALGAFGEPIEAVVISDAPRHETSAAHPSGRAGGAPVVASPELARSFRVPGTPYAVVLDRSGVVRAKGTVNDLEQMEGLVETARHRMADPAHANGGPR